MAPSVTTLTSTQTSYEWVSRVRRWMWTLNHNLCSSLTIYLPSVKHKMARSNEIKQQSSGNIGQILDPRSTPWRIVFNWITTCVVYIRPTGVGTSDYIRVVSTPNQICIKKMATAVCIAWYQQHIVMRASVDTNKHGHWRETIWPSLSNPMIVLIDTQFNKYSTIWTSYKKTLGTRGKVRKWKQVRTVLLYPVMTVIVCHSTSTWRLDCRSTFLNAVL